MFKKKISLVEFKSYLEFYKIKKQNKINKLVKELQARGYAGEFRACYMPIKANKVIIEMPEDFWISSLNKAD